MYEVSDLGRIRSLPRETNSGRRGGRLLPVRLNENGYPVVALSNRSAGRLVRRYVHHLVLEAFVGPRPDGMNANHDPDPSPSNCSLANLRWDTQLSNIRDKLKHGTQTRGENHSVAKITEAQAHEIILAGNTATRAAIGKRYGIGPGWAHLQGEIS